MHTCKSIHILRVAGGARAGGRTAAAALGDDEALSWRDEVAQDLAALGAHEGARRHRDDELARVVDVRRHRRARADLAVLVSSSTLVWHLLASDPVESVLQYSRSGVWQPRKHVRVSLLVLFSVCCAHVAAPLA